MVRQCNNCKTTTTLFYKKQFYWYHDDHGNTLCRKCWMKLIHRPRRGKMRIMFLGVRIYMPFRFRKGICSIIGCDEDHTDFHHIEYHFAFPLLTGVELCDMHHRQETWKQEDLGDSYSFDWSVTKQMVPYIQVNNI